ncbi:MAG TPA: VWA domain-containing protein [Chlamydiales bacterium]|jgi:hypothetical protein|nr:VWA domain-containing protein [Chlamydiales bacterium]
MPKQKKILVIAFCVAISLSIHIGFFLVLQTHSVWFNPIQPHPAEIFSSALEKTKRDQILKESFALPASSVPTYAPGSETASSLFSPLPMIRALLPTSERVAPSLSFEELLSSYTFPIRSFSLPTPQTLDLFVDLPKDLFVPSVEQSISPKQFHPYSEPTPIVQLEKALGPPPAQELLISFSSGVRALPAEDSAKIVPSIPIPALPEIPTLAELGTINLSDSFEAELTFSPRSDGPGYLFALTLIPHKDLQIPPLRQHLIFLIDRSNSIQHERLLATKSAVSKAIEELEEGDSFNIIAFDSKMEKLSPSLLKATPNNLAKANEFLNKIQLGNFFSPGDLYRPLFLTIPSIDQDDEVYTAILLTDGESLSKKGMQEIFARDWTLQNRGRVSLYALAMEADVHLGTIDAACHFNKGRLIYANSLRGLKRKLVKLTQNIKHPIGKHISCKAISKSPQANIDIYPAPTPPIYLDQPYVLLGTTETPDDFILFVQGRLKNQWLNIKKTISFVNGKKGGSFLKSEWALQKAYQSYEKYIIEGDQKYLTEARILLDPFNLPTAFQ